MAFMIAMEKEGGEGCPALEMEQRPFLRTQSQDFNLIIKKRLEDIVFQNVQKKENVIGVGEN